jgi:hypothetical protein
MLFIEDIFNKCFNQHIIYLIHYIKIDNYIVNQYRLLSQINTDYCHISIQITVTYQYISLLHNTVTQYPK